MTITVQRSGFLAAGASIGLLLATGLPVSRAREATPPPGPTPVNARVRIAPDNRVFIDLSQSVIGQGIATTLPAILADDLDAR